MRGFSGDGVRIVPGQQAPTGLDSHLVKRFTINNAFGQVIQNLITLARTVHTYK